MIQRCQLLTRRLGRKWVRGIDLQCFIMLVYELYTNMTYSSASPVVYQLLFPSCDTYFKKEVCSVSVVPQALE